FVSLESRAYSRNRHAFPARRSSDLAVQLAVHALELALDAGEPAVQAVQAAGEALEAAVEVALEAVEAVAEPAQAVLEPAGDGGQDRKSTRLNSSHVKISYSVFCLKK